jgi:signal peptidase I
VALEEPYLNEPGQTTARQSRTWELGADEYFMMGDNRGNSRDSREFGPVERARIVGEAIVRYWPPTDWGVVTRYRFPIGQS